jgi:phosphoenolpyruvate carboxykinase (GTP)
MTSAKLEKPPTSNGAVLKWVEECAVLLKPARVQWVEGTETEKNELIREALQSGDLEELNQEVLPGCYLHHSAHNDVARTESLTFICSPTKEAAGPNNNWMDPAEGYAKLRAVYDGAMNGRTLYVVPFIMGPAGSPFSKVGVEITDSLYVVLNMGIMTRMGNIAWKQLGDSPDFTKCLHAKSDLNESRRFICHFPQDNTIWSVGSGYGGNALLGKKCLALRIASALGQKEGWLAEHMLILGIENPTGEKRYVAAAFPSACGKTNLAMLVPPAHLVKEGYKVWTLGDDIAWLRVGSDGRLWATNPEAGYFGVVPGTNNQSNPNAMKTIQTNTIYTNVAKLPNGDVWWEGHDKPAPAECLDWKGERWTPDLKTKAAHPNSRFTVPAKQCPSIAPNWEDPAGVPLDAILFGGRRAHLTPLITQSFNWSHGVFLGATMASETTAAQQGGNVGIVRRDPMAMLPFCGYNMADYFTHWLSMGEKLSKPPQIFLSNWFRQDKDGKFMWPGFGDNMRVLLWILDRVQGRGAATESPIGHLPTKESLDVRGLDLSPETITEILAVDRVTWEKEIADIDVFFAKFGDRFPAALKAERDALAARIKKLK